MGHVVSHRGRHRSLLGARTWASPPSLALDLRGLRVVGEDGKWPSLTQSLKREAFTAVGAIPFVGPLIAVGLWLWFLVGCLLVTFVPVLFGWRPYIIESGSMEPRIKVGDVVLASPQKDPQKLLGHVTTFNDYDLDGQPVRVTDANGMVTTSTYDAGGRLRMRTVNAGGAGAVSD